MSTKARGCASFGLESLNEKACGGARRSRQVRSGTPRPRTKGSVSCMSRSLTHALVAGALAIGAGTGTALAAPVPEVEGNDTPASATALDPANQCYARGSGAITAGDVDLWSFGASV